MDKSMARHSVRAALQLGRSLTDYLELAKVHTTDAEYDIIKIGVAEAIDKVNAALIDPSLSSFPELNDEIEGNLRKYGKYL